MHHIPRSLAFIILVLVCLSWAPAVSAAPLSPPETKSEKPEIALAADMGDSMAQKAARVKADFQKQAESLFKRDQLGWNWSTIQYLYDTLVRIPSKLPAFTRHIMEQGRILGLAGSLIMLTFLAAVLYSLFGYKKVWNRVHDQLRPIVRKLPEKIRPYLLSGIQIVVEALIPLILLGFFSLINALISYRAPWFQLLGKVLILWAIGGLILGILRESLTKGLFPAAEQYGADIFRLARLALLYVLIGMAGFWSIEAFQIREDALALLRFAVSISIVVVLFLLFLKKNALLSLLPQLPYQSYQWFMRFINRFFYPLMFFSFIIALLWCLGYQRLGQVVLTKIWASAAAFVGIMLIYHSLQDVLQRWTQKTDASDEAEAFLIKSTRSGLLYASVIATAVIVLNLLGLLTPLQQLMSFPVFRLGVTQVSFWIIIRAALILLAFVFGSRLLQAYLDYKVYPALGIDAGLGYALNTFFKYAILIIGFLISLRIVGIDLKFLLVFAGAIGIGVGLGLQNMAANIISGFSIIFGGKLRKGDWIEAGDTLGVITDIYLRATKVRTRDNIEYLIPNSDLISQTIVNYSFSSPLIRIGVPVGVSYDADPREVKKILVAAAENEPMVTDYRKPAVRFIEYGDNSINFELLIWIDVRETARKRVRSRLYFAIFDALKRAGIEIPFPQRDLHIRSDETKRNG